MKIKLDRARLRRFIQFPLTRIVVGIFWVPIFVALGELVTKRLPAALSFYKPIVLALCALLGYYTFVRILERRKPGELLALSAPLEFLAGLLIGGLLISSTVAALHLFDVFAVTGRNDWTVILAPLAAAVLAGVLEELIIRGIVFRIAEEWFGSGIAIAGSAALFGALHIPNPGSSVVSVIAIALEAGVMLAAAYMLTRRLWLPIGTHIAWNFVQGGIFGIATSGVATKGWLISTLSGPKYLSGGAFGAEASVVAIVICFSAGMGMLWLAYRRNHWIRRRASLPRSEVRDMSKPNL